MAERERVKVRTKAAQLQAFTDRVGLPFEQEGRLVRLQEIRGELETLLSGTEGRERIAGLVEEYAGIKEGAIPEPQREPEAQQPEPEAIDEIAVADKVEVPERPGAVIIPFPTAPPGSLTLEWRQSTLFDNVRPAQQRRVEATNRAEGRAVQLSLF
jgi:hypothetical protein